MNITYKLSYLSIILASVWGLHTSPAVAGFDWVAPPVSKTAPVADVETAVLPPQSGVATHENGTMDQVAAPSTVPARVPPALSYPDEKQSVPMVAPTSLVEPAVPVAPVADVPTGSLRRVPPPVQTPSAPVVSSSDMVQQPSSVYPPRGNVPARPLGASAGTVPAAPIRPARVSVPDDMVAPQVAPVVPVQTSVAAPLPTVQVTTKAAPIVASPVSTPAAPRAVVDGFGTNVPLSLALEQIIPDGWTVEDQVHLDQTMMVSWAGGRPWDKVLEDMLYAHGVRVTVTGSSVVLFRATGAGVPPVSAPSMSSPVSAPMMAPTPAPVVMAPAAVSAPLPERVVSDVSVVPAAPAGTGPAVVASDPGPVVAPDVSGKAFDASAIDLFSGRTNEPVQTVLARWGRMAHVTVEWNVGADLTLPQSFAVNATFPRAVERLLNTYRDDPMRPVATLETDPATGAAVLRVTQAGAVR